MAKEYERVFRVTNKPKDISASQFQFISDIYLCKFLRLRRLIANSILQYKVTLKFNARINSVRNEWEFNIPYFLGGYLFARLSRQIHKKRSVYKRGEHKFELNEYIGLASQVQPLIEIEFDDMCSMLWFNPEKYEELGEEVSNVPQYRNYNLYKCFTL